MFADGRAVKLTVEARPKSSGKWILKMDYGKRKRLLHHKAWIRSTSTNATEIQVGNLHLSFSAHLLAPRPRDEHTSVQKTTNGQKYKDREVGFRDKEIGQGHSIGSSRIGHPTIKDVQKVQKRI